MVASQGLGLCVYGYKQMYHGKGFICINLQAGEGLPARKKLIYFNGLLCFLAGSEEKVKNRVDVGGWID